MFIDEYCETINTVCWMRSPYKTSLFTPSINQDLSYAKYIKFLSVPHPQIKQTRLQNERQFTCPHLVNKK